MSTMTEAMNEGRLKQFEAMMEQLEAIQVKYRGVRGELLAKVRAELMRLNPTGKQELVVPPSPPTPVPAPSPAMARPRPTPSATLAAALPSCRMCGRGMKREGDLLKCERGHTRALS